ncbi:MAG: hypothetical protein K6C12_11560 [Oscillospiraceae bacterium]|nr:hypothetical protein [Oscillospiraceae bacterium]
MEAFRSGKKSLELCCYIAGAGAFAVFLRWLQRQLAFNELGLADPSALHVVLVLFIAACAAVFLRFVRGFEREHIYMSDSFATSFSNSGKVFRLLRIAAGAIVLIGAVLLFMQTETDRNSMDYRIVAILGMAAGVAYPLWLGFADRDPKPQPWLLCLLGLLPILWLAAWLIICYKHNTINSVFWSFLTELAAVTLSMDAFFRLAGFVFDKPAWKRCLFACMLAAVLCFMCLADERYLGEQIMFLGIGLELTLCCWIMVKNLEKAEEEPQKQARKVSTGGFEEL